MYEKDLTNLLNILNSADKILDYTSNFQNSSNLENDQKTFDAILMNFIIIGESTGRLSEELKSTYNDIPWRFIYGLRNIIAHDYFGVLAEEIWEIIQNDLPEFRRQIQNIIDRER